MVKKEITLSPSLLSCDFARAGEQLKELENAQLYYNLGNYMGNNYESAVITAKNALKEYPYSKYKEQLEMLVLKARFLHDAGGIAIHGIAQHADQLRAVVLFHS